MLLRPDPVPAGRRGWLPLLAGVAVARAVRAETGLAATLKWPNDVLIAGAKLAGILAEQAADGAVVIGIGVNVAAQPDDLPSGSGGLRGTSIAIEASREAGRSPLAGETVSRQRLLAAMLRHLEERYAVFRDNPDPAATGLLSEYRELCATLGQRVRAELPAGGRLTGEAVGVNPDGCLLIALPGAPGPVPLAAGDIVHLR